MGFLLGSEQSGGYQLGWVLGLPEDFGLVFGFFGCLFSLMVVWFGGFFPVFLGSLMEWSGFFSLRILYLGHVGSSGGCRATGSLGTWWELGLGLMGVLGVLGLGFLYGH